MEFLGLQSSGRGRAALAPGVAALVLVSSLIYSWVEDRIEARDESEGGEIMNSELRVLRVFLENIHIGTICAMKWHKVSVMPAQAGIHPISPAWIPACAGMTDRGNNLMRGIPAFW